MRDAAALPIVLAAVALAYATGFAGAFHYDDFRSIAANPDVQSWPAWWASMPGIRPLTKATYAFNASLSAAPAGFIAFDIACHALGAGLVFVLARRWLRGLAPGARRPAFAALVAALAFALHPAQTEAVTYVAGRSVALSALCALAALLACDHARDAPAARGYPALAALLFAFALAARETAWTVPVAAVLLDTARGDRLRVAAGRALPLAVVLAAALALGLASPVYRHLLGTSLDLRGPLPNLFAQVEGVAYLVAHPLLTLRVNFDPDVGVPTAADADWWLALAMIALALALAAAQFRRRPWLAVGILWFFLQLLPTNGVVARYDLVNDRQLYLALVGPALVAGVVLARLQPPAAGTAAAAALCALLGIATAIRNTDYRSERALWEATARVSPGKARVWTNVGWAYQQSGDAGRARQAYAHALALDPSFAQARLNLESLAAPR